MQRRHTAAAALPDARVAKKIVRRCSHGQLAEPSRAPGAMRCVSIPSPDRCCMWCVYPFRAQRVIRPASRSEYNTRAGGVSNAARRPALARQVSVAPGLVDAAVGGYDRPHDRSRQPQRRARLMLFYDPVAWVVGALAARALAANVRWALADLRGRPYATGAPRVTWRQPHVVLSVRALYLLGLPVAALGLRVVPPALLGLTVPRDPRIWLGAVGLTAMTLAVVAGTSALHAHLAGRPVQVSRHGLPPSALGALALNVLFLEAHWAFFRAAGLSFGAPSVTMGAYFGVALLGIEAWSDPARRAAWTAPDAAPHAARGAALVILSTTVFLLSGSSVAAFVMHIAVGIALAAIGPETAAAPDGADGRRDRARVEPTVV